MAEAIRARVGPDEGLRARVIAAVGVHCFFAAMEQWASEGGSLEAHVRRALSLVTDVAARTTGAAEAIGT